MSGSGPSRASVRSADGTLIAYEVSGCGPPLVLVDGPLCHRGLGPARSLAARLADRFQVVTYDRRGRGASTDTRPWAIAREVEDLDAVVDACGGWAYLHGTSTGGLLAMFAVLHGVAVPRLTMFEPLLRPRPAGDAAGLLSDLVGSLLDRGLPDEALAVYQRAVGVPDAVIVAAAPSRAPMLATAATLVYDCLLAENAAPHSAARVGVPALVLRRAEAGFASAACVGVLLEALPSGSEGQVPCRRGREPAEGVAAAVTRFLLPPIVKEG